MMIDTEQFDAVVDDVEIHDDSFLKGLIMCRLRENWMTVDEIRSLAQEATDFARRTAVHAPPDRLPVIIHTVVALDVCTVQKEGEAIDAAIERAIRAEVLVPLKYMSPLGADPGRESLFGCYLRGLRRIRVEDVDKGLAVMNVCCICLFKPRVGALICLLQCNHAFHLHCVARWLQKSNLCPLCKAQVHDYL